ncbi:DUF4254 domain-containing protein [Legionella yabuuchiae]|uniref:DUF4254 domain-containing protein n=1 Tax=Legionella yabuuchiae TaxID=376727 RepID=UPI00105655C0|nr:DUF4254 domain-containing protein [Legionella yabuuchiae]
MSFKSFVHQIVALQHEHILSWKKNNEIRLEQADSPFLTLAAENHAFNYQLWHAEDRARRDDKGFEYVYQAKREIDHCNQQRNNRMESMDRWLFQQLKPASHLDCPVNSETPGMMIDRLSILALKAYHMTLQTERTDVDESHRQTCLNKLLIIEAQQAQLQECLVQLLGEVQDKTRTFRVYHQFKMYNDPKLNPELYGARE